MPPYRDNGMLSLVLVQIKTNFPEPNTAHAATEWND
jgi:hypothetical protein